MNLLLEHQLMKVIFGTLVVTEYGIPSFEVCDRRGES